MDEPHDEQQDMKGEWGTDPLPDLPVEVSIKSLRWDFAQDPTSGGMEMRLTAIQVVPTPQGPMQVAIPPAYRITFTEEGWRAFKRTVEADGHAPPTILAAGPSLHVPNGVRLQ